MFFCVVGFWCRTIWEKNVFSLLFHKSIWIWYCTRKTIHVYRLNISVLILILLSYVTNEKKQRAKQIPSFHLSPSQAEISNQPTDSWMHVMGIKYPLGTTNRWRWCGEWDYLITTWAVKYIWDYLNCLNKKDGLSGNY